MGRGLTTRDYDRLLAAFRELGDSYRAVGRAAQVDHKTAQRAWETGWPAGGKSTHDPRWKVPIRLVIEREREEARAQLARERPPPAPVPSPVPDAKLDAAAQLAHEAALIRALGSVAGRTLTAMAAVLPAARELAGGLAEDVASGFYRGKPDQAARVLDRFTGALGKVATIAEQVQQMEHRRLGQPTDVLALGFAGVPPPMTWAEAEGELRAAQNAVQRARELGLLPAGTPDPAAAADATVAATSTPADAPADPPPAAGDDAGEDTVEAFGYADQPIAPPRLVVVAPEPTADAAMEEARQRAGPGFPWPRPGPDRSR